MAQLAWEHLQLDELKFVLAAQSPHKAPIGPPAEVRERLLRIALRGRPWAVETLELDRGGTSYTVDTLEALASRDPGNAWILVLGSDQAASFPGWRCPERIWELASIAAVSRPGFDDPLLLLLPRLRTSWSGAAGELVLLPGTGLDHSSSAIREWLGRGLTPVGLPPEVLAAILAENLYR
jgi:nicotinate-nucleotide adenylyltransferase